MPPDPSTGRYRNSAALGSGTDRQAAAATVYGHVSAENILQQAPRRPTITGNSAMLCPPSSLEQISQEMAMFQTGNENAASGSTPATLYR